MSVHFPAVIERSRVLAASPRSVDQQSDGLATEEATTGDEFPNKGKMCLVDRQVLQEMPCAKIFSVLFRCELQEFFREHLFFVVLYKFYR